MCLDPNAKSSTSNPACGRRGPAWAFALGVVLTGSAVFCAGCATPGGDGESARKGLKSKGLFDDDIANDKEWQQRVKQDRFPAAGM